MNIAMGITLGGVVSPSSGFDPATDVPNCRAYFDAADTSKISVASGTDDVTEFTDQTGTYTAVDVSGATRPTTGTTINGRNVLTFADDGLVIGSATNFWNVGPDISVVLCASALDNFNTVLNLSFTDRVFAVGRWLSGRVDVRVNNSVELQDAGTVWASDGSLDIVIVRYNGTTGALHVSVGGSTAEASTTVSPAAITAISKDSGIFSLNGSAAEANTGKLAIAGVWDREITLDEANAIGNKLNTDWGATFANMT